ncbi:MAG: hypothetical protein HFF38_12625 [Lawsonibacter sp.]|nr:hypothetical protein [Lawsonibacter sp.]
MILKVLGTQSPISNDPHNCPGFLITEGKYKLMLDCGSGSHRLMKFPTDLENLYIGITHLHEDHYSDIGCIQYGAFSNHNLKRIQIPINILLPATPIDKYNKIVNEKDSFAEYNVINEEKHLKIGDMNVSFCKTDHPIETYAVKVNSGNKTIVYTSDTSFSAKDRIVKFSQGADLLICESSLLKEHGFPEISSHLTAEQAGIIAKEANVKGLMLTHFWPEELPEKYVKEAKRIFLNVVAAMENQTIDIPIIKEIDKDMR